MSVFHSKTESDSEIAIDLLPLIRIHKDGKVERLLGTEIVPPSLDPKSNVLSKDVIYSPETNLSSRLYIPNTINSGQKLPLLVYFHGGGFCIESPFSPLYHSHLNWLVAEVNIVVVSVDYRLAPEYVLPAAYDDSWAALEWVFTHLSGHGPEEWLNSRVDFGKVFLGGDSAGANIAYHVARRVHEKKLSVEGLLLVHPYFWSKEPIGNEPKEPEKRALLEGMWHLASPTRTSCDDPLINVISDENFANLGCNRVLVTVAGKDVLRDRGLQMFEKLEENGWKGKITIWEAEGEDHVFHLFKPESKNAAALLGEFASFFNH